VRRQHGCQADEAKKLFHLFADSFPDERMKNESVLNLAEKKQIATANRRCGKKFTAT
jgi:hypothetical protein